MLRKSPLVKGNFERKGNSKQLKSTFTSKKPL